MRDRLICLFRSAIKELDKRSGARTWGDVADYLIAHGVTVQEWISVKDRLPEAGEFVLLQYAKNNLNPTQHAKNTMAVGRYEYKLFLVEGCSVNVTHWMPLPQPPKGE